MESEIKKSIVDVLDTVMQEIFNNGTELEKREAVEACANFIVACTPGTESGFTVLRDGN
jgi:hypothetical protein